MTVVLLQCIVVLIHAQVMAHATLPPEFALVVLDIQAAIVVLLHLHHQIPPLTLLLPLITSQESSKSTPHVLQIGNGVKN